MHGITQNLAVIVPPVEEPVSLDVAKNHLKMTLKFDDALITSMIKAARRLVEKETRRALVTRTYELRMNRFPVTSPASGWLASDYERLPGGTYGMILMPKPPLIAVNSITYLDPNGNQITLDPSQYLVDSGGVGQGAITPAFGLYYPQTRNQMNAVRINFDAGYGPASSVPDEAIQAMLLLIGNWYRNREAASATNFSKLTLGAESLLSCLDWGFYG